MIRPSEGTPSSIIRLTLIHYMYNVLPARRQKRVPIDTCQWRTYL
jgi:hypothetical protein